MSEISDTLESLRNFVTAVESETLLATDIYAAVDIVLLAQHLVMHMKDIAGLTNDYLAEGDTLEAIITLIKTERF